MARASWGFGVSCWASLGAGFGVLLACSVAFFLCLFVCLPAAAFRGVPLLFLLACLLLPVVLLRLGSPRPVHPWLSPLCCASLARRLGWCSCAGATANPLRPGLRGAWTASKPGLGVGLGWVGAAGRASGVLTAGHVSTPLGPEGEGHPRAGVLCCVLCLLPLASCSLSWGLCVRCFRPGLCPLLLSPLGWPFLFLWFLLLRAVFWCLAVLVLSWLRSRPRASFVLFRFFSRPWPLVSFPCFFDWALGLSSFVAAPLFSFFAASLSRLCVGPSFSCFLRVRFVASSCFEGFLACLLPRLLPCGCFWSCALPVVVVPFPLCPRRLPPQKKKKKKNALLNRQKLKGVALGSACQAWRACMSLLASLSPVKTRHLPCLAWPSPPTLPWPQLAISQLGKEACTRLSMLGSDMN